MSPADSSVYATGVPVAVSAGKSLQRVMFCALWEQINAQAHGTPIPHWVIEFRILPNEALHKSGGGQQ